MTSGERPSEGDVVLGLLFLGRNSEALRHLGPGRNSEVLPVDFRQYAVAETLASIQRLGDQEGVSRDIHSTVAQVATHKPNITIRDVEFASLKHAVRVCDAIEVDANVVIVAMRDHGALG